MYIRVHVHVVTALNHNVYDSTLYIHVYDLSLSEIFVE